MRRRLLVGMVAAAIVVAVTLVWHMSERNPSAPSVPVVAPEPVPVADPAPLAGVEEEARARALAPIWRRVDARASTANPQFPSGWSEAGRVLVDVSDAAAAAETWQVGDTLAMPLPQLGETFDASIERIVQGPGYSRSFRGFATGRDGGRHRFVLTVGPTRVLAYIDAPGGPYELVADTRSGWLLPTSSMLAGFDFSKPDYLLPERPEREQDPR